MHIHYSYEKTARCVFGDLQGNTYIFINFQAFRKGLPYRLDFKKGYVYKSNIQVIGSHPLI